MKCQKRAEGKLYLTVSSILLLLLEWQSVDEECKISGELSTANDVLDPNSHDVDTAGSVAECSRAGSPSMSRSEYKNTKIVPNGLLARQLARCCRSHSYCRNYLGINNLLLLYRIQLDFWSYSATISALPLLTAILSRERKFEIDLVIAISIIQKSCFGFHLLSTCTEKI